MLWESADAEQSLRDRFGFHGLDGAAAWLATVLAEHWDLVIHAMPRLTLSDQNAIAWVSSSRGPLVVKWSRAEGQFSRLEATTRLLAQLAAQGIPVAEPLPARDGRVRIELLGHSGPLSLAVLPEVEGEWLDVAELPTVHAAGACLAAVHTALATVDAEALAPDPPPPLPGRVTAWLTGRDPGRAPAASARLAELLAELPAPEQPLQLVHGDFRAANLLVRDGAIAAVLDFDEVHPSLPIADLAQASTYLATLFRDWGPTPAPARTAFRAGYESVRPLGPLEARWLEALMLWMGIAAIPAEGDGSWDGAVGHLLSKSR